jgi:hypothetical protein
LADVVGIGSDPAGEGADEVVVGTAEADRGLARRVPERRA